MQYFFEILLNSVLILWGFLSGLILITLWFLLAGAIQEFFCEQRNGEPEFSKNPQHFDEAFGNIQAVVISDLHCDTWKGELRKVRRKQLKTFAAAIAKRKTIKHLIINGDIIDIPKHPKNDHDPSTLLCDPSQDEITIKEIGNEAPDNRIEIAKLFSIQSVRTTYIIGNHDIGLQSTRSRWPKPFTGNLSLIWSPAMRLHHDPFEHKGQKHPGRRIHIEHGHFIDPFIWLYIKQAIGELLRTRDSAVAPVKRSLPKTPNLSVEKIEYQNQASVPLYGNLFNQITMLQFRHGARRILKKAIKQKQPNEPFTTTVLLGHTHAPDRYFYKLKVNGENKTMLYMNSGSWTADRDLQTYLLIYDNGWVVGPYHWDISNTEDSCLDPHNQDK